MFPKFFKRFKHILITLRFSILSIFMTLFVISIVSILAISYLHSAKSLLNTARGLMDQVSAELYQRFTTEIQNAEYDDGFSAKLIQEGVLNATDIAALTKYTFDLANKFTIIESAYWADTKGNVVAAKYEPNDSITTRTVNKNVTPPISTFIYRDINGNVINQMTSPTVTYNPLNRPWFLQAQKSKKTIWTPIYLFKIFNEKQNLGVTVATPVFQSNGKLLGIFAMDLRLDWLSWYVGQQKLSENSIIFIVSKEGKLIAFPKLYENQAYTELVDIHAMSYPWIAKSFDIYQAQKKNEFNFNYNGKTYLANFRAIPQFASHGWFIGVVAPENDFIGSLKKADLIDVGIGLIILIIGIFIVSWLVTGVVNPIKILANQTGKIKHFILDEDHRVKSRIKEVAVLADAIYSMRAGLRSFQKYVPANLVRQLIKTGQDAVIGGSKKNLTIFFSDIENFTSIAEHTEPNALMNHTCEYFEEMSKILLAEKATIDKYIGDAIMAFWGAPLITDHPCERAARAALTCLKRLNVLNSIWRDEDKAPFFIRIGIHTGDAIVGNVGSEERINYTVLGDAINFASRIEAINKVYHTHILVSEAVYLEIKDKFVLRKIDHIVVKGKEISSYIYELLAEDINELSYDINNYRIVFDNAFLEYQNQHWDKAISLFHECLQIFPSDNLAIVFIKRCETLKLEPPHWWDGVWRV